VFLDIEKAFDTTWHTGLLYKLTKLNFSTRMTKLINSFLFLRKFRVSVEGEVSTPRCMKQATARSRAHWYNPPEHRLHDITSQKEVFFMCAIHYIHLLSAYGMLDITLLSQTLNEHC
jgi:hypothetical protein